MPLKNDIVLLLEGSCIVAPLHCLGLPMYSKCGRGLATHVYWSGRCQLQVQVPICSVPEGLIQSSCEIPSRSSDNPARNADGVLHDQCLEDLAAIVQSG